MDITTVANINKSITPSDLQDPYVKLALHMGALTIATSYIVGGEWEQAKDWISIANDHDEIVRRLKDKSIPAFAMKTMLAYTIS